MCMTHLLPSTRVESHHHPVHERDIELFGEVEYALQYSEHSGKHAEKKGSVPPWQQWNRLTRAVVVVVVVDVELLTNEKPKAVAVKWAEGEIYGIRSCLIYGPSALIPTTIKFNLRKSRKFGTLVIAVSKRL